MVKKVAVLTSGGDAPGMNAAVRAIVRTGLAHGLEMYAVYDGYKGLYEGKIERMYRKSVAEKLNRGGTFIGTARLPEFVHPEIRQVCVENLQEYGIDALVTIGGDGTYRGAHELEKMGVFTVGIPGTIDNDVAGTDYSIGFDTALTTIVEAIDKLRDTSSSHRRCSIVEVMGRHCGALAIWAGIAVGAEVVICEETGYDEAKVIQTIQDAARVKKHAIVIVSENFIDIKHLEKVLNDFTPFEARTTILGYVQRGGCPSPRDRVLASMMGAKAVECLVNNISGVCMCSVNEKIVAIPFEEALKMKKNQVEEKYKVFEELW